MSVALTGLFQPVLALIPCFVAYDLGEFRARGIDVRLISHFRDPRDAIADVGAGAVHVTMTNPSADLNNAVVAGLPVLVVASGATYRPGQHFGALCVSDRLWQEGVRRVADLRGRTIHFPYGWNSATGLEVARRLRRAGLDPLRDVQMSIVPDQAAMVPLAVRGALDVLQVYEPFLGRLVREAHVHPLEGPEAFREGETKIVLLMNADWVRAHPDDTTHVLAAYLTAVRRYQRALDDGLPAHPEIVQIIERRIGMVSGQAADIRGPYIPRDGHIDRESIQMAMEDFRSLGYLQNVAPLDRYIDESHLARARRLLGGE